MDVFNHREACQANIGVVYRRLQKVLRVEI